jgi:hypothetical protein
MSFLVMGSSELGPISMISSRGWEIAAKFSVVGLPAFIAVQTRFKGAISKMW